MIDEILRLVNLRRGAVADTTRWRAKNTNTFKNALLHVDPSDLVFNATYGEYTVGGDALFRAHHNDSWEWMGNGKWQEMRTINSPGRTSQNGDNHYGESPRAPRHEQLELTSRTRDACQA